MNENAGDWEGATDILVVVLLSIFELFCSLLLSVQELDRQVPLMDEIEDKVILYLLAGFFYPSPSL